MKTRGAAARGLALFFGGFGLLNVLGNLWHPGFDANLWWLDLRRLAPYWSSILIAVASLCLLVFGLRPPQSKSARWIVSGAACCLLLITLGNALNFYVLLARGRISSRIPIPFSLLVAAGLALVLVTVWRTDWLGQKRQRTDGTPKPDGMRSTIAGAPASWSAVSPLPLFFPSTSNRQNCQWRLLAGLLPSLAICMVCAVVFTLAQMFCFGKTDYRRAADVTVVLGARVYADGRPSDALADRVRTACSLYQAGMTRKLLFSGGPGDGTIHETESMKRMAVRLGVKPEDILLDKQGLNTAATVKNTKAMFSELKAARILVVSHFYHLPRIKLAYQRAGLDVYTVPARESYILGQLPYNMAREVAALWVYYLRPLQT